MKKLLLLLVFLLIGCGPKTEIEQIFEEKASATFILHYDEGFEISILRRGTQNVYVPVDEWEMDWNGEHYEVEIELLEGTMFEYFYAIYQDGFQFEENIYEQHMYRTIYFESDKTYEDYFNKESDSTVEVMVTSEADPLRGMIIASEGRHVATMADGKTTLENATLGTPITIYDLEGKYKPVTTTVQESITVELEPRQFTTVLFKLDNRTGIDHIKVAGMTSQFGYKYFQQNTRQFDEDGRQLLYLEKSGDYLEGAIELPLGSVLSYSYTIGGAGFGVEKRDFDIVLRDVEITENMIIEDKVENFGRPNEVMVTFIPNISEELTFRVYWQTIRMKDQLSLFFPKDESINYRYMLGTEGYSSENLGDVAIDYYYGYDKFRELSIKDESLIVNDTITGWLTFDSYEYETNITKARDIFTGIMMADYWNSTYLKETEIIVKHLETLNPEYIMLSPVWNFNSIIENPTLESFGQQLHSVAMPDIDVEEWAKLNSQFKLSMYQQTNPEMLEGGLDDFFTSGGKPDEWWQEYNEEIYDFYMYYAVVAEENGFELIRLPDTFVGETLQFFSNQQQAQMYDEFMNQLVDDIREVYSGKIYTSVEIFNNFEYHFTYLEKMDYLSNKFWYSIVDIEDSKSMFRGHLAIYQQESVKYGVPFFVDQLAFFSEEVTIDDDYEYLVAQYYDEMFKIINETEFIEGVILFGYPYIEGGSLMTIADQVISDWFEAFE